VKIAICDDDLSFTNQLKNYIVKKGAQMQGHTFQVTVYHCGEDFLRDVALGVSFNLVFMDIEMDTMNGIAVGNQFRENSDCDDVIIIYISSHNTYSDELLDIGNVRFIKKPYSEEKLDIAFDRAVTHTIKYMKKIPQKFVYTVNKDSISVDTDNIVYLKKTRKVIEIYTWNSDKSIQYLDKFYSSISETIKQLPQESFFQCERSYIVNFAYVGQAWNTVFVMADVGSTHIPIGKTYRLKAKAAYFRHMGVYHDG